MERKRWEKRISVRMKDYSRNRNDAQVDYTFSFNNLRFCKSRIFIVYGLRNRREKRKGKLRTMEKMKLGRERKKAGKERREGWTGRERGGECAGKERRKKLFPAPLLESD